MPGFTEEALSPARHSCGNRCPPPASLLLSLYWNCRLLWFHLLAQIENVVQVEISLIQNSKVLVRKTFRGVSIWQAVCRKGQNWNIICNFSKMKKKSNSETLLAPNILDEQTHIKKSNVTILVKVHSILKMMLTLTHTKSPVIAVKPSACQLRN